MGLRLTWIPIQDKCCCLGGVKSGTIIIGWMGEILSVSLVVLLATHFAQFEMELRVPFHLNMFDHEYERIFLIVILATTLLNILINGLLLYGAHNDKPWCVRVYVISRFLVLVIGVTAAVFIGFCVFKSDVVAGVIFFIACFIVTGIETYFWTVIYSYYIMLEKNDTSNIAYMDLQS